MITMRDGEEEWMMDRDNLEVGGKMVQKDRKIQEEGWRREN